jgi:hypothetical protein
MTRIQASNSEWERYRTTDPGLPEPEDLFRGVTLRGDSIRWTRSASEVDTPECGRSLEDLGTVF